MTWKIYQSKNWCTFPWVLHVMRLVEEGPKELDIPLDQLGKLLFTR